MKNKAFTLIELMVAMSLLAIIGLMMASITNMIAQTTKLSNRTVDAAAQARLAFDRMGMDLASAIARSDIDFVATNPTATAPGDFLTFFSSVSSADPVPLPALFTNRNISLIGYRIAPSPDNGNLPCLIRAGRALGWNDRNFMGLGTTGYPPSLSDPVFPVTLAAGDFDVLAPAVVRAVVGFQLYPDNDPVTLQNVTTPLANSTGQIVYNPPLRSAAAPGSSYIDTQRISALIVGIVVMDPKSLKLLNTSSMTTLTNAFSGIPTTNQLPLAKWMSDTSNLASLPASIPLPVTQSLRLYQRAFPINPYGHKAP